MGSQVDIVIIARKRDENHHGSPVIRQAGANGPQSSAPTFSVANDGGSVRFDQAESSGTSPQGLQAPPTAPNDSSGAALMVIHLNHALGTGRNKAHPGAIQAASVTKSRATCIDRVPVRLPRAQRQAVLQVLQSGTRSRNGFVTKVALADENRLLPFKLKANLDHRTHGRFLSVHPREILTGEQPYHSVQCRAVTNSAKDGVVVMTKTATPAPQPKKKTRDGGPSFIRNEAGGSGENGD